ncbi:MAG: CerR family C-terminal domain-containing protein [Elusimicrobiaceae bacterium]|nr:CerR family C-terminal domain-containing protein [Elusimicrobiaceae bacterium]
MKDTRKKILRTAARLFAQKGFSGTSVRDIITTAGVNVSAINYYFGDKRGLYKETLLHLAQEHHNQVWGKNVSTPTIKEIESYSREQALSLLHRIFDRLLEHSLSHNNLPLERIFTRVELESAPMRKMLLSYVEPLHELPYKLLSKVTGLPENSPTLVVVSHSIFSQIMLSECHRLVILNKLGIKHIPPVLRQQIKKIVWQNTLAILNSYKKGIKKK